MVLHIFFFFFSPPSKKETLQFSSSQLSLAEDEEGIYFYCYFLLLLKKKSSCKKTVHIFIYIILRFYNVRSVLHPSTTISLLFVSLPFQLSFFFFLHFLHFSFFLFFFFVFVCLFYSSLSTIYYMFIYTYVCMGVYHCTFFIFIFMIALQQK